MFSTQSRRIMIALGCTLLIAASTTAQGITQPKQGQGGSVVKGAAGTEGSTGDSGRSEERRVGKECRL